MLILPAEPAAAVDPAVQVEVLDLIADLAPAATVVFSSHNLADVERVCDNVGVLAEGRLVYQGSIDVLLARTSRPWRVVVRPPAVRLRAALAAEPWASSVREGKAGHLTLTVGDPDAGQARLPEILAATSARLIEVSQDRPSLREVFLDLTAAPEPEPAWHPDGGP